MTSKTFSHALGEINDKYVNEAIAYQCKKKKVFSVRHKWLSRVACFFLVTLLTGSAVLTFSVEARAAFFGWVREQYENLYVYFFEGGVTVSDPVNMNLAGSRKDAYM